MSKEENLEKFTEDNASEMGRKGGLAKKGSKHLSTLIRSVAENIDWDKTNLKNKDEVKVKYGKNGWKAIIYVAITKAMAGDSKAMDWLAKNAFGTKIDFTTDDEPINKIMVEFVDGSKDTDTE